MRTKFLGIILLLLTCLFAHSNDELEDYTQDLNQDGQPDLYYEHSEFSYTQLLDRNFDGRIDESYQFENRFDLLIGGRLDNDFDGEFETQIVIENGIPIHELVDSNKDRLVDIVHDYLHGEIDRSRKYVTSPEDNPAYIEHVTYNYGFPSKLTKTQTDQTAEQFHKEAIKVIRPQYIGGDRAQ